MSFVHLHNHTQYSLLDGACRVDKMIALAKKFNMPAVAMTDHGNMFGTIDFYNTAKSMGVKPIIGIEVYIVNKPIGDEESKKEIRHHLVLLAKNLQGYKNLMKLSSKSFIKGFYYKPRIDKEILTKYSEGLVCLSACLQGEIPSLLLRGLEDKAKESVDYFKRTFPNDYYIEIQNHGIPEEKEVAPLLVKLAGEMDVPLVVTNDCHYLAKEDADAHDVLICIQTGKNLTDTNRMKYNTSQLYFKSEAEMRQLFPNLPEAYENTIKIADKIDLELDYNEFLLPHFDIPKEFQNMEEYIVHLCSTAAKEKYPEITEEIQERIDYEISVIKKMGYIGYFLIVKDFIDTARKMDIPVGPGRGSAVGSIVSYLLGITQLDPLKYGLFFERFLNPDRIGMPDIDIDFCAEGRGKIIDYVVEKYGRDSVAQIITFGTLGAKSVIKDVARVMEVSVATANEMTKLIPTIPKITLETAMKQSPEFAEKMNENEVNKEILKYSIVLEGLIRQIGIHAAGVVIGPGRLNDYVPLATSTQKGGENAVLVQYEGKWLDDLKILKMDFLGLKTLTLIKKATKLIKESQNIEVDMEKVDLYDKKSYELLANGQTDGVFQFESAGMKKYLCELQPNMFEDLIAMVALYRPGPMQFISTYINRKHGKEKIKFVHPLTESSLAETYGVTVYQEQVMQIAREMGKLSGAEADTLRKAISKKKLETMEKMKTKFVEGAISNGVEKEKIEKIWSDWLDFANYAFNKSHATAYAFVAFQTAYLKAHYPVEFMAALLSLEDNSTKIPYFIDECRKMEIEVLAPNINKSDCEFKVQGNKILFGLRAIKNVGEAAINAIIQEREKNGPFNNFFELCSRVDSMCVNKTVLESLTSAGALDDLEGYRSQKVKAIEIALEYASSLQAEKKRGQMMLFDSFEEEEISYMPKLPDIQEWGLNEKLKNEKEILGFYWSDHPLNQHNPLLGKLVNIKTTDLNSERILPNLLVIGGVITSIAKKNDRKGNPFAIVTLEDIYGRFEISMFNKDYLNFFAKIEEGNKYLIIGKRSSYNGNNDNMLRIIPYDILTFDELIDKLKGKIYINLEESKVNNAIGKKMMEVFKNHPGSFNVNITIPTKHFKTMKLENPAIRIFPSNDVLNFLEKQGVSKTAIILDYKY